MRQHEYFQLLRSNCPEEGHDNDLVPLDIKTPRRFDNLYYVNLLRGHALLTSDSQLVTDDTAEYIVSNLVWQYAFDQRLFFKNFVNSMIKMGNIGVLTVEGQVRHNCRYIN